MKTGSRVASDVDDRKRFVEIDRRWTFFSRRHLQHARRERKRRQEDGARNTRKKEKTRKKLASNDPRSSLCSLFLYFLKALFHPHYSSSVNVYVCVHFKEKRDKKKTKTLDFFFFLVFLFFFLKVFVTFPLFLYNLCVCKRRGAAFCSDRIFTPFSPSTDGDERENKRERVGVFS